MTRIGMLLATAPVFWSGTIVAEVDGKQPGAQHWARTVIDVRLVEEQGADSTRLRSVDSCYHMKAAISGLGSCRGTAVVTLTEPVGRSTLSASGAYRLVLERGFFGWACGHDVPANGARDVVVGMTPDPEGRWLDRGRMIGHYSAREQTKDSSYDFKVEWDIRRESGGRLTTRCN